MLKVMFLIRSLHAGGAERQLSVLARALVARGHHVSVAVFYGGGELESELTKAGIPIHDLRKAGRWDVLPFLWRLWRLVCREKPQVLHGYLDTANILTVVLRPFCPRVRMVWGVRASFMDHRQFDRLTAFSYGLTGKLAPWAHGIIINSQAGKAYHAQHGYPVNRMVVIPNGIDTERYAPQRDQGEPLRRKWGVAPDQFLVGLVGRLDPMKDHGTFLQAAALVAQQHRQVRFVCVGQGAPDITARLHSQATALNLDGVLIWAGHHTNTAAVYNALNLLVLSSTGEGFPNVVGEAMACGVPCVVTDVGDAAHVVGETGRVVPPGQPTHLAQAIMDAVTHPVPLPVQAIRQRIAEIFSVEHMVQQTEQTLENLFQ